AGCPALRQARTPAATRAQRKSSDAVKHWSFGEVEILRRLFPELLRKSRLKLAALLGRARYERHALIAAVISCVHRPLVFHELHAPDRLCVTSSGDKVIDRNYVRGIFLDGNLCHSAFVRD